MKKFDTVRINRIGILNGQVGTITEVKYVVDLKTLGAFALNEDELSLTTMPPKDESTLNGLKTAELKEPTKTPTKKVKATVKKDVKIKRPYTRKAK